jgi:hypothetical protein
MMGPTSSLKFVPVKESFTESHSIGPQLSDGSN